MDSASARQYSSKLISEKDVPGLIHSGDRIVCHGGMESFLGILDENALSFSDVDIYTIFLITKEYGFLDDSMSAHIRHHSSFVSPPLRASLARGQHSEFHIAQFSEMDDYVRYVRPTVFACQATPPDEDGYFYMGYNSMGHQTAAGLAERVIVQVNPLMPRILGDCNKLHISRVDAIYEAETVLPTAPPFTYTSEDRQAARFVAQRIPDGATIQIGVGRVPDAIGEYLMDHRHLGVHTEVLTASLVELMKAGAVDNSRKALVPGKTVFGFTGGSRVSREIYEFADNNQQLEMRPIAWVNDSRVIARNSSFVSVNSALAVDLTGQVCAETVGLRQFSGTGGQLDFVRGALWADGGRSYIVMNSAARKKDGSLISKIDLTLPFGSAVTTPRTLVDCIVTEYGVAELRFKSTAERARELIAIAHPAFRDELTAKARQAGYLI